MIVTCDECGTSFNFDEKMIKPSGSKVRCSKCQSIFTAYPPAETSQKARAQAMHSDSVSGGGGLDDLDLDEIEKELELDFADTDEFERSDQAEFGFQFEEDEVESGDSETSGDSEGLDFSELGLDDGSGETSAGEEDLNFDLDLEAGGDDDLQGDTVTADMDDELNFDLDLGEEPRQTDDDSGGSASEEPDFDLDFGLGDTGGGKEEVDSDAADGDLDFELDLDLDDDSDRSAAQTDLSQDASGEADDLTLDFDDGPARDSAIEFDETAELGLSGGESDELDFSLELDEETPDDDASGGADAAFDTADRSDSSDDELDLSIDLDESGGADEDTGPEQSGQPVDFELDLDLDGEGETEPAESGSAELEETDEIDLADLEDMIEDSPASSDEEAGAGDVDLDLSMDDDSGSASGMTETDELDLSDLDDVLADERDDASDAEEEDLSDLLQIEPDADESDLDFDLEETDDGSRSRVADAGEEEEEEFDLSDLDDMLELDEGSDSSDSDHQDFDLELDLDEDDGGAMGGSEFEEPETEAAVERASLDEAVVDTGSSESGFDMGMLDEADEEDPFFEDEEPEAPRAGKSRKRGLSGLMKFLLVLVLLGGGGYAAYTLTQYFGVEIPYMDTVKDSIRNVPYVGEWLGPPVKDDGNLNFTIPVNEVNGYFVQNEKLGQLYVIEGKIRNRYEGPRRFVRITGKLYANGRNLKHEKTVFAGNVLTQKELAGLDQAAIDKILGNRFGRTKANVKINPGGTIPFMLVFSNLAPNLDEYTVEVADSAAVKKKA